MPAFPQDAERLAAALWPALMILTLGLLAATALIPKLSRETDQPSSSG